jgi:hypothetical protein
MWEANVLLFFVACANKPGAVSITATDKRKNLRIIETFGTLTTQKRLCHLCVIPSFLVKL